MAKPPQAQGVASFAPPPVPSEPAPAEPADPTIWQRLGKFHAVHWRLLWFFVFFLAPLGSLGDETTYTGGTAANVFKFVGILIASWTVAALFMYLHVRRIRNSFRDD